MMTRVQADDQLDDPSIQSTRRISDFASLPSSASSGSFSVTPHRTPFRMFDILRIWPCYATAIFLCSHPPSCRYVYTSYRRSRRSNSGRHGDLPRRSIHHTSKGESRDLPCFMLILCSSSSNELSAWLYLASWSSLLFSLFNTTPISHSVNPTHS
jgi:hypothetical protein